MNIEREKTGISRREKILAFRELGRQYEVMSPPRYIDPTVFIGFCGTLQVEYKRIVEMFGLPVTKGHRAWYVTFYGAYFGYMYPTPMLEDNYPIEETTLWNVMGTNIQCIDMFQDVLKCTIEIIPNPERYIDEWRQFFQ
jgi:hypothetical protein